MRAGPRVVAAIGLAVLTACGGGDGGPGAQQPCGIVLGQDLLQVQGHLDVEAPVIQIEVRFLTATQGFADSLGITWPNFSPLVPGGLSTTPGSACGPTAVTGTDVVGGAEGQTVAIPEGTGGQTDLPLVVEPPYGLNQGARVFTNMGGPGSFSILGSRQQQFSDMSFPFVPTLPPVSGVGGQSLNYLLTDEAGRIQFLTEMLQDASTRLVEAPKLIALDNQTATIFVGTEVITASQVTEPHRTAFDAINPGGGVGEAGLSLRVTPSVAASGIVRLTLQPTVAQLVRPIPTFTTSLATGKTMQAVVPIVQVEELKSEILVQDGVTMIVGGLRDDTTMNVTRGVPILDKLPVVGTLFRQHNQLDLQAEIFFVVTPRILKEE